MTKYDLLKRTYCDLLREPKRLVNRTKQDLIKKTKTAWFRRRMCGVLKRTRGLLTYVPFVIVHTSQAQTHVLSSHDATSTISLCIYLRFQTQNTTYRKRIQIILLVSLSQVMQIMAGGIYKVLQLLMLFAVLPLNERGRRF